MIKKTMLAACFAALAFAALPALASATTSHPGDPFLKDGAKVIENTAFEVSGGKTRLEPTGGEGIFVECESVEGPGVFEDEETGSIKFTFHECHSVFNISCTSAGEPKRTITTTTLPFHLKTVAHEGKKTPGVLITPGAGEAAHGGTHFATFSCGFVGIVEVGGTGIIGTITSPEEGKPSNTAKISFVKEKAGHQTHRKVTGDETEYDLKASFNNGKTETASQEGEGTLTFAEGMEPEIQTTDPCV